MLLGLRKSRTGTPLRPPQGWVSSGRGSTGKERLPGEGIPGFKASSLLRAQIIYCFSCVQGMDANPARSRLESIAQTPRSCSPEWPRTSPVLLPVPSDSDQNTRVGLCPLNSPFQGTRGSPLRARASERRRIKSKTQSFISEVQDPLCRDPARHEEEANQSFIFLTREGTRSSSSSTTQN